MLGTSSYAIALNSQNSLLGKNNRQTGRCALVFSPQTQSPYRENTFSYGNDSSAQLVGGINLYAYVRGNPISRIDPMGLADLVPMPPTDPAFARNNALPTGGDHFVVGTHGRPTDSNHVMGPSGKFDMTIPQLGDAIIAAGWDGQKPIEAAICHGAKGGNDSVAAKLAQYLSDKIGAPVQVIASPNQVIITYVPIFGSSADPGPGGWRSFIGKPNFMTPIPNN